MPVTSRIIRLGNEVLRSSSRSGALCRGFSSKNAIPSGGTVNIPSKEIVTKLPPLSEPLPFRNMVYATPDQANEPTKVTTLPNGLRVASEKRFGQFCTVGVVIDSGSRYEGTQGLKNGLSHFLEKLSFGATNKFENKQAVLNALEQHAGICDCQSSRDTLIYAISANSKSLEPVTEILGEVVLRPQVTTDEVHQARQVVQYELQHLLARPEQETLLMDMIHKAAYGDQTLGLPKICPEQNVQEIDRQHIMAYFKHHFDPSRMVLAGVGVEHDALVEYANKYFVEQPSNWMHYPETAGPYPDTSKCQYLGGYVAEECEIPLYPGSDLPELSHIVIAVESSSHQDPDFIPICVLNMMMGGGGSFSAGGPGKGMYTRLYTHVLNRYHWMYSATAYNQAYGDTGLFCIHASSPPNRLGDTLNVIVKEMYNMGQGMARGELDRAKSQLQSMLMMNLEARPVVFEDIGRQVLATGERKPHTYFIDAINAVTEKDIERVANRILSQIPAIAARGKLDHLPQLDKVSLVRLYRRHYSRGKMVYHDTVDKIRYVATMFRKEKTDS